MKSINRTSMALVLAAAASVVFSDASYGQAPGRGGRGGGLPGATAEQLQAVAEMNNALTVQSSAVTAARNELAAVTFASVKDDAAIKAAVEKLRIAELALATRRAEEFAKLQGGPNKLKPEQVAALIAAGGNANAGRGGRGGPAAGAPPGNGRGN
jgi:Spy/CpxP family protein refolding chaperone